MIDLKYKASSGNVYDLKTKELRTRTANYHDWAYNAEGTQLQYGFRVANFSKQAKTYQTEFVLTTGTVEERAALIDKLHTDFELDIYKKTPGRIIWGDWYIECYATISSTEPDGNNVWTDNTVSFYCPRPFWIKEAEKTFYGGDSEPSEFLDFEYDFKYDFAGDIVGIKTWPREFPFASKFELIFSGPATNPQVAINGHHYQVFDNLAADQNITIENRTNTIVKTYSNGLTENLFDYRNKEESVFDDIPGGTLTVTWSGAYPIYLKLYEERSEPSWSL